MYFISTGSVEVLAGDQRFLLGSGDFFGEIALLFDRPRTAEVVALGYCNLLVLHTSAFRAFLDEVPEVRKIMESVAAERLEQDEL
ncbi:MAG: cyclic nucleotide-binding domain-containing protein [Rhodospirillaceae bacterium]|nr:cyclic nucleotide-binding domain-containing protein [Rhodospirillaceae bacterium]MBT6510806.1 cyclic nucleotide-binding domain-containing protein [Rhodospirillaceae bacterium]MBT7611770.1 cyclic nucleotide-binding domain-containing protein [Rhodospirillaceae bacterium]MBT7647593.1 cyclic nucleotide-binding domain-containing protein [Rhodospirillaceae bacterium]